MEENKDDKALEFIGEASILTPNPSNPNNPTLDKDVRVWADKKLLSEAIKEGVEEGLEDIFNHFKKQTKIFTFALLGMVAMLAVIALVLSSFHNMPLR
jgi:hypothetical protein